MSDEAEEQFVVVETDAVSDPITVVVHTDDAFFTLRAVMGSGRPDRFALPAVLPVHEVPDFTRELFQHFCLDVAPLNVR